MYKALIIDDEKPVRVAITALAEWDKWDIEEPETAVNGKDALEKLHRLNVDIVFVDMNMPIMNGIQFMDRVSVEFPDIKFIVISGYSDFQYAHSAIRHRAVDYLLKPIVADDLNEALRKAVSS
jgi:two-component system response regulator YesN